MGINRRQFLNLSSKTTLGMASIFLLNNSLLLTGCGSKKIATPLPAGSEVTALGDSLTYGYGVRKKGSESNGQDYPAKLAEMTSWSITNAGVNGDTSQQVLDRLDEVIDEAPKLVLLGIGGNDVLQKVSSADTKANIINIINQLKSANIPVVLIAQPHFSASALLGKASDNPIYQEIAETTQVPLFAKAWSKILSDKSLKSDQIHANAQGYQQFSESLYVYLQEIGYIY